MLKLKSVLIVFSVSLTGWLGVVPHPLMATAQVESQIYRPLDTPSSPTSNEREAAISELIARLERTWRGSYEAFIQRQFTPLNDMGDAAGSTYTNESLEALEQRASQTGKPLRSDTQNSALELKTIQRTLTRFSRQTRQRTALVYLRPGVNYTTLILVTPEGKPFVYLNRKATKADIQTLSRTFLRSLSTPRLASQQRYLQPAQQLYQALLQPLEAQLAARKIDTLMLCTGETLRGLPFAALHDGKQFLVERYNLSLIPAFSLVQLKYTDLRNANALAAGADTFSTLAPLPAVPLELANVQRSLPNSQVLLNADFTIDGVRSQLRAKPYSILHLATHGEFRPGAAKDSFIQFWQNPLRLDQLTRLGLTDAQVQLLVLSACKSALGDKEAELGFAGFALFSGVPSAIGSVWSISDPGTLAFMSEFYRQLRTAPTLSAALRQTQIKMISGALEFRIRDLFRAGTRTTVQLPTDFISPIPTDLNSPYYWAPFVLIGDPW